MSMWNLPEEIQVDIFLRLRVNSILACRCACKYWCSLLRDPKFIKDHLNITIQSKNPRLMYGQNSIIKSIDYNSVLSSSKLKVVSLDYPFEDIETKAVVTLGSCNGLICLGISGSGTKEKNYICIWNPSTSEYKKIKVGLSNFLVVSFYCDRYGFGYDSNIDDYKLVRFFDYSDFSSINTIQVYTLGSNCWKTIRSTKRCMFSRPWTNSAHGVLINGVLHWSGDMATTQGTFSKTILCFDINSERLGDVPLPKETIKPHSYREVGMSGDCLCVVFSLYGIRTDIWVMQDYGVTESWTKVFTTTCYIMTRSPILKLIWYFQNGEILVYANEILSLCDRNYEGTKKDVLRGVNMSWCLESYVESLVSLESGKYVQNTRANGSNKRQRLR